MRAARAGSAHVAEADVAFAREPARGRRGDDARAAAPFPGGGPGFRSQQAAGGALSTSVAAAARSGARIAAATIGRVAGQRDRRQRGAADELVAVVTERAHERAAGGRFHFVGDLVGRDLDQRLAGADRGTDVLQASA